MIITQRAQVILVQLTAYGTRGGGRSLNTYDAASNGNFDDDQPLIDTSDHFPIFTAWTTGP
ncbi:MULTISPECIES: hypothetical protein [unclassified Rhizobium]|uniref:hypothetical protein n=1 Tax=unclassified Rhizobium TaxID=2613769 RepID=UPI00178463FA|nr:MULTISPECIES: hypothetical protein [unclassified Rhizobium]MBD9447339.1 hypothetical protein [Rhizobium sp. RHZ01]NMN71837.1 hypothetical protein [Rhizobium sp. 57MFTsu3.2]